MDPQKFNNTKRLSRDTGYVRPKKTYQDTMTPDDIKEKLKEYKIKLQVMKKNNAPKQEINDLLSKIEVRESALKRAGVNKL
jgi:hypothetical protein